MEDEDEDADDEGPLKPEALIDCFNFPIKKKINDELISFPNYKFMCI